MSSSKRSNRSRIGGEKFYVVMEGQGRGIYPTLSTARLVRGTIRTLPYRQKADEFHREAMLQPAVIYLADLTRPDTLLIWTDGSASPYTKSHTTEKTRKARGNTEQTS